MSQVRPLALLSNTYYQSVLTEYWPDSEEPGPMQIHIMDLRSNLSE